MSESAIDRVRTDLGLSVPADARFRRVRVLLSRLLHPFLIHQAQLNTELIAELHRVSAAGESLAGQLDAFEAFRAATVENHVHDHEVIARHDVVLGVMDEVLRRFDITLEAQQIMLEAQQVMLEEQQERQQKAFDRQNALIELVQLQAMSRAHELVNSLADELEGLRRSVVGEGSALRGAVDAIWPRIEQLDLFLDQARRSLASPPALEQIVKLPSALEANYPTMQATFRGDEQIVIERVSGYVEELVEAAALGPVLDIGCGRGELLELLRDRGADSYGIETNAAEVEACARRGLRVYGENALEHLKSVPSGSLGAVVAIHVIEHLEIDDAVHLLEFARHTLAPGGLVIIETPNPENVRVGAHTFHLDPTHRKPMPPLLLEWLVKMCGFEHVEVRRFERAGAVKLTVPSDSEASPAVAQLVSQLNSLLLGAEDYAVVAHRF